MKFFNWILNRWFSPRGVISDKAMAKMWLEQSERRRAEMIENQSPREHNAQKHLKDQATECLKAFNAVKGAL